MLFYFLKHDTNTGTIINIDYNVVPRIVSLRKPAIRYGRMRKTECVLIPVRRWSMHHCIVLKYVLEWHFRRKLEVRILERCVKEHYARTNRNIRAIETLRAVNVVINT